jgi:hypothetical protein
MFAMPGPGQARCAAATQLWGYLNWASRLTAVRSKAVKVSNIDKKTIASA